ncbi:FAD-dependent oxidoreductase [Halobacteriales archaeon QS_1_68_20]|nr:MAG: FAD-dependent oxidoreductase [Halobacteriales archaeon QS_1_68_20]
MARRRDRDRYDVVIAGAGPAGAQCARELAARDYDVLVLETEREAEFPAGSDKSTGGTFPSMLRAFDVPDRVVMNHTEYAVLESPSEYYRWELSGAVLEFADFKQFLVDDSREKGAEYRFDARVHDPVLEGGEVVGVRYDGDQAVYGDVIVDATGPSAPLAKALGVSDLQRQKQAIGIEYEFEGVDVKNPYYADLTDAMMLRLDEAYAPGGYAWIFHTGADTAKVGLCYIQNGDQDRTIDEYLRAWVEEDPRLATAERVDGTARRGSAHIQPPGRLSTDNFVAIGDTVPSIDPLWGEGIHKGMKSARAAAEAVDHCLSPGGPGPSAEHVSRYDELWHEEVAPDAGARRRASDLLYRLPDERIDLLLADLDRLGQETLTAATKGDLRALAKLVNLRDLPLLASLAWDVVR